MTPNEKLIEQARLHFAAQSAISGTGSHALLLIRQLAAALAEAEKQLAAAQSGPPGAKYELTQRLPGKARVVWCMKAWNGGEELRLARRMTFQPYSERTKIDPSWDCWWEGLKWEGLNDHDGLSFSDATVKWWGPLIPPPIAP